MELYVFCKDPLKESDALYALRYTMGLQKYQDSGYRRLYLSEVNNLYVCNLEEGLQDASRLLTIPITQSQRQSFYREAIRRQLAAGV